MNLVVHIERYCIHVVINKQTDLLHVFPIGRGTLPENVPYQGSRSYQGLPAVIRSDYAVEAGAAGGATGVVDDVVLNGGDGF